MKHTLLCVDDESDNVDALERLFRKSYKVLKATSGAEALQRLRGSDTTVIISDQRMPGMSGVEFLAESIKTHPSAIRILLTGYTDIDSVISAINSGQVYRYVTKPWDPVDLNNAVNKAVERFELGEELREKNAALSAALTELQTLDQAKSEFIMLVNHELKTPLTSIISFSDLLAETTLDADQKKFVLRIRQATERLQAMIRDTMEFISAQTAQTKIDLARVDLKSVAAVPDVVAALAAARDVSIDIKVSDTIHTDEKVLRNVMTRLMHNAAKFAQAGSTITVRAQATPVGFEFVVENAAPLIPPARIAQLLKPFTLNENAINHSTGTGMGLSICQALLKLLGSELKVECPDGKVRVSFVLPKTK